MQPRTSLALPLLRAAPLPPSLQERGYVTKDGQALVPTSLGRVVTAFLERYFPKCAERASRVCHAMPCHARKGMAPRQLPASTG